SDDPALDPAAGAPHPRSARLRPPAGATAHVTSACSPPLPSSAQLRVATVRDPGRPQGAFFDGLAHQFADALNTRLLPPSVCYFHALGGRSRRHGTFFGK